jgi:hypothetical protein
MLRVCARVQALTSISALRIVEAAGAGVRREGVEELGDGEAPATVSQLLDATVGTCTACAASGRMCASCVQRRRRAWSLVSERGETVETAAGIMRLSPERVGELIAEEADRRELRSLRCDSIPVGLTRSVVEEALARDPDLTLGEIAHWLDMRQADFERAFLGKGRDGRPKPRVTVSSASRLMIALGRAPNELPGC